LVQKFLVVRFYSNFSLFAAVVIAEDLDPTKMNSIKLNATAHMDGNATVHTVLTRWSHG